MFDEDMENFKVSRTKKIDKKEDCKFKSKSPIAESRMGRRKTKIKRVNRIEKKRAHLNKSEIKNQTEECGTTEVIARSSILVLVASGILYASAVAAHAAITALSKWEFLQELRDIGKIAWGEVSQNINLNVIGGWVFAVVGVSAFILFCKFATKHGNGGSSGTHMATNYGRDSDSNENPRIGWDD